MRKDEITVIGFCERASTSVKMGGIGSAILMRTEKRKMYTVGVWTRMTQCQKGKKREPSLREKEKQIEADLFDRIVTNGGNYTVLELVEKYVSLKTGVRHNTVAGYKTVINMLKKESFGNLRIDKVRLSDAKAWLIKLQQIDGRGYSSIHSIRGVLRPAFQMAVDDDLLRKNPFEFELASVIVNDSVTREAITRKQQRDLLKFIQEDKHFSRYYDAIYILFHTGLRISEFCGLTVSEIEFGEMRIKVDHQLQRTAQMQYVIEEPKTDKGIRYVPMTEAVAACFRRIIANRKTPKVEPMVEGYAGFLFLDKNDMPMVALHWEKYWSISFRNTIRFTVSRCRKLPLMYAGTPFALIWQNPG